ncbi:MAG: 2'-deoxycytidine 5'-triphosphate deaminase [Deltaproteobacteria bacterium]|nr:2'-deoxycytidine 5'-triphosphate deaminase [Deltaproteobacteria bacterium]
MTSGILPIQDIQQLIKTEALRADRPIEPSQLQPNSVDLRVGTTAYRARYSFLPVNQPVAALLSDLTLDTIDLSRDEGAILETGKVYVVPLREQLALPAGLMASANPKSSTGRLDVMVRMLTDRGSMFDAVPAGYQGPLYLEIVPRSFPIRLRADDTLAQLRICQGGLGQLSDDELRHEIAEHQLILAEDGHPIPVEELALDDGVFLTVYVASSRYDETIGFSAKKTTPVVDLRRRDHTRRRFWNYIPSPHRRRDHLILHPNEFYIFSSRERVVIPPHLCAEMVPYDAKSGELRTHYAGFFDSGFGMGTGGARVVLEVRNLDVPFLLQDGQRLFRLRYHRNTSIPQTLYGTDIASNYQGQSLRLSKHFGLDKGEEDPQLNIFRDGAKE